MEHNKELNTLRGAFPRSIPSIARDSPHLSGDASEGTNASQCYAIAGDGDEARRYRVILRSGTVYNFSYALLPNLILEGNQSLLIKSHGIQVTIEGRNLKVIEDYLSQEALLWVRESASGTDDGDAHVFVRSIEVEGEGVNPNSESI